MIDRPWNYCGIMTTVLAISLSTGCRSKKPPLEKRAVPSASAKPATNPSALIPPPPDQRAWQAASGITLPILIGEGIGPIRFGATIATVERLMALPCQEKTATFCRHSDRGVNFFFNEEGALVEMYIGRTDRKDPKDATKAFGVFNGLFTKRATLGMIPEAIIEIVGKPTRVEKVNDDPINATAERHHYPSMVLEYDFIQETGKLALSGIVLRPAPGKVIPKPTMPAPAPSAATPATATSAAAVPSAAP